MISDILYKVLRLAIIFKPGTIDNLIPIFGRVEIYRGVGGRSSSDATNMSHNVSQKGSSKKIDKTQKIDPHAF